VPEQIPQVAPSRPTRRETFTKLLIGGGAAATGFSIPSAWTAPLVNWIAVPVGAAAGLSPVTVVSGVAVVPIDSVSQSVAPVAVTFDDVQATGTVSLAVTNTGPAPPAGFELGVPPTFLDISTTVVFGGSALVSFHYSGLSFRNESALELLHFTNGSWSPLSSQSIKTGEKIISGRTTSFSPFTVVEPAAVATTATTTTAATTTAATTAETTTAPTTTAATTTAATTTAATTTAATTTAATTTAATTTAATTTAATTTAATTTAATTTAATTTAATTTAATTTAATTTAATTQAATTAAATTQAATTAAATTKAATTKKGQTTTAVTTTASNDAAGTAGLGRDQRLTGFADRARLTSWDTPQVRTLLVPASARKPV